MSAPAISTNRSSSVVSLPGVLAIAAVALAVAVLIALSFVGQPGAIRPAGFAASEMSAGLYQHTLRENSVSAAPAAPAGPNVSAAYQHTLRENSVSAAPAAPAGSTVNAVYQHTLRENRGNQ